MKTALAEKYADPGESDMAPADYTDLATQVAELRSDVRHLQSDVSDIKAEQRAMSQRMEAKFDAVDKKFEAADKRFEEIKDSLASAKVWAFGLYVALAGTLLYVIARSAKWI